MQIYLQKSLGKVYFAKKKAFISLLSLRRPYAALRHTQSGSPHNKRVPADFNLWGERRARRSAIQVYGTLSHKP